ncbi:ROK family protein [Nakamurella endophytica]|uniref:Glucokinase n=1 Tax=Nakamurella endophytica TaxID=1748367 RepID=A0A917WFK2_9ACTN|nr:ROK family protein [Nakamurella endophytica]GGL98205.1 glucokinase [Nakamurella endophytica]
MQDQHRPASAGIGIDVGGSKIAGVVIEPAGSVVARVRLETPPAGGTAVVDACLDAAEELLAVARSGGLAVGPIVLAMPGTIDSVTGFVRDAPVLKLVDFGIVEHIQAAVAHPTTVIHDVKAAAFGELVAGAGIGQADVAYLNLGTGVSMAFIFDWEVHRGVNGLAGEIGHVQAEVDGRQCNCGRRGCLETVASGPAILRSAAGFPTLQAVAAAARDGDRDATRALATAADHLGRVLSDYLMVLDLQVLMVGGGVSNLGPPLLRPLQEAFDRYLADVATTVRVVPAALGSDSGVLGAAHRSRLLRDDRRSARW